MNIIDDKNLISVQHLNNFLLRYLTLNLFVNFFLYLFPSKYLTLIIYFILLYFFLINLSKIFKNFYFILFAQMTAIFLVNLTYLNFILSFLMNEIYFNLDFN